MRYTAKDPKHPALEYGYTMDELKGSLEEGAIRENWVVKEEGKTQWVTVAKLLDLPSAVAIEAAFVAHATEAEAGAAAGPTLPGFRTGWLFIAAAVLTVIIRYMISESGLARPQGNSFVETKRAVHAAVEILVAFDVIAGVLGLIGVFLLVRIFVVHTRAAMGSDTRRRRR